MQQQISNKALFANILKCFEFKPTEIGDFILLSDKITIPIYSNVGEDNDTFTVKTTHRDFIKTYVDNLPELINHSVSEYDYRMSSDVVVADDVINNYMDKIKKARDPSGIYSDQYALISQLTEYNCFINSEIRVGLKRSTYDEYHLLPVIVLEINMRSVCKLINLANCKINKLTLDTFVLNTL